jgi:protein required for attachment to host cells
VGVARPNILVVLAKLVLGFTNGGNIMNLTINQIRPTNYMNNQLKNNKDKKFILNIDDKKISEEEDKKLYEVYKKSHMAHSAYDFKEYKKNVITFPPTTAPGIVRKAWREKLEKCTTEEERLNMMSFGFHALEVLNKKNGNVPKDINGYLDFMEEMQAYIERYNNCPGVDGKYYEGLRDVANGFITELGKYK